MKKAIVSVINDLATDQRVARMCGVLHDDLNYDVLLVGRKLRDSLPLDRPYKTKRMHLLFNKGALFYAEYNFRLFWFLLFHRSNVLVANDLDTLLPNFLVSIIRRKKLVYDSHEYFTGVPELENRNFVRKTWLAIERFIFPKLKSVFTVNDSIAGLYKEEYGKELTVVRNIPPLRNNLNCKETRKSLNLHSDKKILILQGAGINVDRGAEELVQAMMHVEGAVLYIIGGGDVIGLLRKMVVENELEEKVVFKPKMPYQDLMQYTANADLGLTMDKPTNINYRFSLPNKVFDYIQAGVPILSSSLVEIKRIIEDYDIGETVKTHNPKEIAAKIAEMLHSPKYDIWKENLKKAAKELCWEVEKTKVINVYKELEQKEK